MTCALTVQTVLTAKLNTVRPLSARAQKIEQEMYASAKDPTGGWEIYLHSLRAAQRVKSRSPIIKACQHLCGAVFLTVYFALITLYARRMQCNFTSVVRLLNAQHHRQKRHKLLRLPPGNCGFL